MSKTKAGGSTKNGRDSEAQRLGQKVFDGQAVNFSLFFAVGRTFWTAATQ